MRQMMAIKPLTVAPELRYLAIKMEVLDPSHTPTDHAKF